MSSNSDTALKKPTTMMNVTEEEVLEFARCKLSCKYFIENYIRVKYRKEIVPFVLFPYQDDMLDAFLNYKDTIILASRQMGKTELSCAYLLWYAMFTDNVDVLLVSYNQKSAIEILNRIKFMYKELPDFIRDSVEEFNKTTVVFSNGSRLVSRATTPDAGRGLTVALCYVDEFSFVPPNMQEEFWAALQPTLSTGGRLIITSTPNHDEDKFAVLWRGACDIVSNTGEIMPVGSNGMKSVFVTWNQHPHRDAAWELDQRTKLGEEKFRREHLCEFVSFESTLINPLVLQGLSQKVMEPKYRTGEVRWYGDIDPECTYFVALDPSLGVSNDFAAIQIIEMPTFRHMGEWLSDTADPKKQVQVLYEILQYIESHMYDDDEEVSIFWSFENNSIGEATLNIIENTGLEYFPGVLISDKNQTVKGKNKRFRRGLNTTAKSKLLACSKLKTLIDSGKFKPVSAGLVTQLKSFVAAGVGYKAKPGMKDDLVMAAVLATRVLELSASWDVFDPDLLKDQVDTSNYSEPMFFFAG